MEVKRGSYFRILAALPAVLLAATLAQAQDTTTPGLPSDLSGLSLEQLVDLKIDSVFGASRYAQKVTEAPSSVTIVTADEIERYAYRTLADILRSVRGFYVTNDRNYSYLGVRGFSRPGDYNVRVLLLVDGHRLNDNIFGGAYIGTEFHLDVDLIERVEIIRGPSSSLYGTSAFFGVVNVITKRGETLKGVDATAAIGSLDSRKGRVSYGRRFGSGVEMLLSATSYESEGQRRLFFEEFDDPSTNNGVAERADSDQLNQVFGKVTFGHFALQGLYGSRDKAIPTASFGTVFNDPRSQTIETQGFLDLQYERDLANHWTLDSRAYYDGYAYDGDYVFDYSVDDAPFLVVNKDLARGNWWGTELRLTRKFQRTHTLALGAEYRNNLRQDQFNYDPEPFFQYLDDHRSATNWALSVQDEIALHERLMVNVGLRHDQYDTFGGTTNPRAGLIYNPRKSTTLKLLYGSAFRAPTVYELFWRQSDVAKPNPGLQPETNRTSELVLEQYLGSHLRFTTTGFYYRINGLITQQTDPADGLLVYNNVETVKARGIELEGESKWSNGFQGRISYTFQNSRDEHTQLALTNSPAHLTQLNLTAPLMVKGLFAGVEFQHLSERRTIRGGEVAGVFVPNLTIFSRALPMGLELSGTLYNVFDNRYHDPGSQEHLQDSIAQDGRAVRVKLTYRFSRAH